ncbi:MAG: cobalamin-dependent protein [Deltaproteobacteria bacterium]|nr:cobalamin-dependent protein [Deltaproteobacteria bacterium]
MKITPLQGAGGGPGRSSSTEPKKVLFTSICRPLGEAHGDSPSVGYELLFGQVTREQGLFSPRATHIFFSLEYVAQNLDAACTVLQYPSKRELIRELRRGDFDVVGVSFVLATFHRMKEVVALVREHAPRAKIVLGGYGTVLSDEVLAPLSDAICREEGVAFMREYLGEAPLPMPFEHPLIVSKLRVFGQDVSNTGLVFAGLGCPNGCDFCCTSHFFKRKHIKLLPTGADIHGVVRRYLDRDPGMSLTILDEDFLLDRKRAMAFRDEVLRDGRPLSIFCFASVKALSRYTVHELLEMGIDGVWIGYEGTRSGYGKQEGREVAELFRELRAHGITILASMIVGFPYQTPAIIQEELDGLLALEPTYTQFLIYGPTPGTPFYEKVMEEGLLHQEQVDDPEGYYRNCAGFKAMVKHPVMEPAAIEAAQRHCYREDFRRLGPSIVRSVETYLNGYRALKNAKTPLLRAKARRFAEGARHAYPVLLSARLLAPTRAGRQRAGRLARALRDELGAGGWKDRALSGALLGAAAWTGLTLKAGLFQHPRLIRHEHPGRWRSRPAASTFLGDEVGSDRGRPRRAAGAASAALVAGL